MAFLQLAKINKAIAEFKKLNPEEQKEFCDTLGLKDEFPERNWKFGVKKGNISKEEGDAYIG